MRKLHNEELLHQVQSGWSNEEDEMAGTCGTHGGDKKCTQNFSRKQKGRDNLRALGVDGSKILKLF